jgi:integrase
MLSKTFSLLFFLKKPRNYKGGKVPIYLRLTIEGRRVELSTQRECEPEKWNSHSGRKVGNKEDVKVLNSYLDALQNRAYDAHRHLVDHGVQVTLEHLKSIFSGKTEKAVTLIDVFRKHNEEMFALVGRDFTLSTYDRYEAALRNVLKFLQYKHKAKDFPIDQIGYSFIADYAFYLKAVRHISHNTAMRYLKYLKKMVLLCVKNGWLPRDPFFAYKIAFDEVDRRPLDIQELDKIAKKEFGNYRLRKVRDIFLFCCYTGLAYVDVKNLSQKDIIVGHDGKPWISIKRQKTGTPSRVPLLSVPKGIIEFYRTDPACVNDGRLLPVLTNQKMNSYLKEIGDVCQIERPITFHLARHTFATTITLSNDVPIETVSKMLGHKDLKTTQHYARIVDRKVSSDMAKLSERLSGNF